MEFSIPISFADLKTKRHPNDYSVSDVISARLLPTKIAGTASTHHYLAVGSSINNITEK